MCESGVESVALILCQKGIGIGEGFAYKKMAGGVASGSRLFSKVLRPQSSDVQAAAMWGVAAATGALWLVQVSPLSPLLLPPFRISIFSPTKQYSLKILPLCC